MRVLVIGGGAREHAVIWKLRQSPHVTDVICSPGNAGIADLATCIETPLAAAERLCDLAVVQRADLTIALAEESIYSGVVDAFRRRRLRIFGSPMDALKIFSSRLFAKEFFLKHHIPTSRYAMFNREDLAKVYVASRQLPIVIRPNNLSTGAGVTVARSLEDAYQALHNLFSGQLPSSCLPVIVEEFVPGKEMSLEIFFDGYRGVTMLPVLTEKRLNDQDLGPETPGMGAYAPSPEMNDELMSKIVHQITDPLLTALRDSRSAYTGVLHLSIAVDADGTPRVVDVGASMGDLEAQVLMPLLNDDLFEICWGVTEKHLGHYLADGFAFSHQSSLAIVFVAQGYPGDTRFGVAVRGLELFADRDLVRVERRVLDKAKPLTVDAKPLIFHNATKESYDHFGERSSRYVTAGGRVLSLVTVADTLFDARVAAYELAKHVDFEGMYYRRDLGSLLPD